MFGPEYETEITWKIKVVLTDETKCHWFLKKCTEGNLIYLDLIKVMSEMFSLIYNAKWHLDTHTHDLPPCYMKYKKTKSLILSPALSWMCNYDLTNDFAHWNKACQVWTVTFITDSQRELSYNNLRGRVGAFSWWWFSWHTASSSFQTSDQKTASNQIRCVFILNWGFCQTVMSCCILFIYLHVTQLDTHNLFTADL